MNLFIFIVIVSLSINILLFLYFRWYIKRQTKGSKSKESLLAEEIEEVNRCIVDINAVTERNILLVEEKIKEIKNIMEAADKRISIYSKELEKSRTGEALYTNLGRGIRAALNTPMTPNTVSAFKDTPTVKAAAEPASMETPTVKQKKPPSKKQIRAHIDELVKEGLTAPQIASQLSISIAEVELALNLINLNNQSN